MSGPEPLFRVLFVCTGNTCRSPLAAAALQRALGPAGRRIELASAGTAAFPGAPASVGARAAARAAGLDLDEHRSRRLDARLLARADLVLLLDPGDLEFVRALEPDAVSRTFSLPDFGLARPTGDRVADPYGGSPEAYADCLRQIESHVERVKPYLIDQVREREVAAESP